MIRPVELLVISAVSFAAATLHNMPAGAAALRHPGAARVVAGPFSLIVAAQTALAAGSSRERTTAECALQGARDRARVSCG